MPKLMEQSSGAAVVQHAIRLGQGEGQGYHWPLVPAAAQLAPTLQCEMGCTAEFAGPTCQVKLFAHALVAMFWMNVEWGAMKLYCLLF